jgi:DNA-directed RNA polymerase subunit RPC12/RpoP
MREQIRNNWDVALRLSDLSAGTAIVAKCGRCARSKALDRTLLVRRYGADARLLRLELTLRCTRCGSKAAGRLELHDAPRN